MMFQQNGTAKWHTLSAVSQAMTHGVSLSEVKTGLHQFDIC